MKVLFLVYFSQVCCVNYKQTVCVNDCKYTYFKYKINTYSKHSIGVFFFKIERSCAILAYDTT